MIVMVSISHIVKKALSDQPFVQEALRRKIVNYGALADVMKTDVERELGKSVKHSAVMMAIRRYAEDVREKRSLKFPFDYSTEITTKTNVFDVNVATSSTLFGKLNKLHKLIKYEKGEILNIIQGVHQVSIVTNSRHKKKVLNILQGEKILVKLDNLASLTIKVLPKFLYTPGIIASLAMKLAWENINILELVTTMNEVTLIVSNKDAIKAYQVLGRLIEEKK